MWSVLCIMFSITLAFYACVIANCAAGCACARRNKRPLRTSGWCCSYPSTLNLSLRTRVCSTRRIQNGWPPQGLRHDCRTAGQGEQQNNYNYSPKSRGLCFFNKLLMCRFSLVFAPDWIQEQPSSRGGGARVAPGCCGRAVSRGQLLGGAQGRGVPV